MTDSPTRKHFRGKPRLPRALSIRFGPSDRLPPELQAASTDNIGVGGAFIAYDSPLPIGTDLYVELDVPTADAPVEAMAEVRWIVPPGDGADAPGMGVEFVDISVEAVLVLKNYFASLTGTDP